MNSVPTCADANLLNGVLREAWQWPECDSFLKDEAYRRTPRAATNPRVTSERSAFVVGVLLEMDARKQIRA